MLLQNLFKFLTTFSVIILKKDLTYLCVTWTMSWALWLLFYSWHLDIHLRSFFLLYGERYAPLLSPYYKLYLPFCSSDSNKHWVLNGLQSVLASFLDTHPTHDLFSGSATFPLQFSSSSLCCACLYYLNTQTMWCRVHQACLYIR